jgi:hypothetical protein
LAFDFSNARGYRRFNTRPNLIRKYLPGKTPKVPLKSAHRNLKLVRPMDSTESTLLPLVELRSD